MLRTSLWLVRPGLGYNVEVSLCRVSFCVQPFVSFFLLFFLFFVLVVSFSRKSNLLVWFCLPTFLFYSFVVRLESGLDKNNL